MPRKVFVAGEILTAADVNTNLMDQAVQRFADAAARTSAIPSPTEGMTSYLDSLDRIEVYNGTSWVTVGTILQVVEGANSTQTINNTNVVADTGLTATITPSTTSSKILVMVNQAGSGKLSGNASTQLQVTLLRGATQIAAHASAFTSASADSYVGSTSLTVLDSPNTASAVTYKTQFRNVNVNAAGVIVQASSSRSSIILMEVAG